MQSSELRRSDRNATRLGFPAYAIWGSELSPFALKLRALLVASAIPYAWLPRDGSRLQNYPVLRMITRAKRGRTRYLGKEATPFADLPPGVYRWCVIGRREDPLVSLIPRMVLFLGPATDLR